MKKILITILFIFLPLYIEAASVLIEVDTKGVSINAIEGMVLVRGGNVESIRIGGSSVLIWLEKPFFDSETREINFSGITPGGFSGKREIFVIGGDVVPSDVSFDKVVALKNDGDGTEVPVSLQAKSVEVAQDTLVPEPFNLYIGSSPEMFDGDVFVSFAAQDKGGGVARYEVAETLVFKPGDTKWKEVQSPYRVVDSLLVKKIYVRVTDMEGNTTISSKALPNRIYIFLILAIIVLALWALLLRKYFRQRSSSYSL